MQRDAAQVTRPLLLEREPTPDHRVAATRDHFSNTRMMHSGISETIGVTMAFYLIKDFKKATVVG